MILFLQSFVILCFIIIIISLFREKSDFLTYSMAAMFAAVVMTFIILPGELDIEDIILAIEWEVIFFLIALFTIVEVLEDHRIFNEIALRVTDKFHTNTRKFFWTMCIISTLCAAFIEDISVAIIFIPMVIRTCDKMRINPTPILLGMTICINIAATLTPFGSSQNILISSKFQLSTTWFILNLGLYFLIATFLTLYLLDRFYLQKNLEMIWCVHCEEEHEPLTEEHMEEHELTIKMEHINSKDFNKNMIALIVFILLLFLIPSLLFVGILCALIFVLINPRTDKNGRKHPDISFYLSKVDYKLIFFFICLFILVFCMEINGTINLLTDLVVQGTQYNLFWVCVIILIGTSILSGFLDNLPITVVFIPIIGALIVDVGFAATPLLIAFILGVNLGGNFLPQGAASDMMTLELAKKNHVHDLTYNKLLKIGGLFALIHILLGIGYLWLYIYIFG